MNTSDKVSEYINSFSDWRGELLSELRRLINEASPEMTEDFKWNVPVWTHNGLVLAISAFKDHVKINFLKGVHLPDPAGLINSGFDSKEHRSINYFKTYELNKPALQELIKSADSHNSQAANF